MTIREIMLLIDKIYYGCTHVYHENGKERGERNEQKTNKTHINYYVLSFCFCFLVSLSVFMNPVFVVLLLLLLLFFVAFLLNNYLWLIISNHASNAQHIKRTLQPMEVVRNV